jgi:hypothetical protein
MSSLNFSRRLYFTSFVSSNCWLFDCTLKIPLFYNMEASNTLQTIFRVMDSKCQLSTRAINKKYQVHICQVLQGHSAYWTI